MRIFRLVVGAVVMVASMNAAIVSFNGVTNGVFSTGFNTSNVLLSGGAVDPHYTLIKLPTGCSGIACQETSTAGDLFGPATYVVLGPAGTYPLNGTWTANDGNSQWIGPRADQTTPPEGQGSTFNTTGIFSSNDDFYVYRMVFNLTALGLNPATANIQLAWLSDNNTNGASLSSHIRMCGIASASDPVCSAGSTVAGSTNAGQSSGTLTPVSITSGFTSGLMALDFVVYNPVVPVGWNNPSGMRVQIVSATADDGAIPEPATIGLIGLGLVALGFIRRK
jgi:hypothetical protein